MVAGICYCFLGSRVWLYIGGRSLFSLRTELVEWVAYLEVKTHVYIRQRTVRDFDRSMPCYLARILVYRDLLSSHETDAECFEDAFCEQLSAGSHHLSCRKSWRAVHEPTATSTQSHRIIEGELLKMSGSQRMQVPRRKPMTALSVQRPFDQRASFLRTTAKRCRRNSRKAFEITVRGRPLFLLTKQAAFWHPSPVNMTWTRLVPPPSPSMLTWTFFLFSINSKYCNTKIASKRLDYILKERTELVL